MLRYKNAYDNFIFNDYKWNSLNNKLSIGNVFTNDADNFSIKFFASLVLLRGQLR